MLISYKWLNDYLDISDLSVEELAQKLTIAGLEVETITPLVNVTGDNFVIGQVLTKVAHENSDKLSVCSVNVGNSVLQIVCGAKNVAENAKVIVALEGAVVNGITIAPVELRGVASNGMICSLQELGIEERFIDEEFKSGIYICSDDVVVGSNAITALDFDDYSIEIGLTPNRMDCLSIYGIAYDLSAILNRPLKNQQIKKINVTEKVANTFELLINSDKLSYYSAQTLFDVKVKQSPQFIKSRLISSGIRPINNVVDITNYVLIEYGQPFHAFDLAKTGMEFEIRNGFNKELVKALDENEYEISKDDLIIATPDKPIAIAGVMGLDNSKVDQNTTEIVLECAIFSSDTVKKTSNRLNLRSDSSLRFEKGIDEKRVELAQARAVSLFMELTGAKVAFNPVIFNDLSTNEFDITVSLAKINSYLGTKLNGEQVSNILKSLNLSFKLIDNVFTVKSNSRRKDLNIDVDIIEEVMRIYGIDNIEAKLPILPLKPVITKPSALLEERFRDTLEGMGFSETITYTSVSKSKNELLKFDEISEIEILNPLSSDREVLRTAILPSLIDVCEYNFSHQINNVMFYEFSKVNYLIDSEMHTFNRISGIVSGKVANHKISSYEKSFDFYYVKGVVDKLLANLGLVEGIDFVIEANDEQAIFHPYQTARILINNQVVGFVGKIHPNAISKDAFGFEISTTRVFKALNNQTLRVNSFAKLPAVVRDVTFWFDKTVTNADVISSIRKLEVLDLETVFLDNYYTPSFEDKKHSMTYRFVFRNQQKTLDESSVSSNLEAIITNITTTLNGEVKEL